MRVETLLSDVSAGAQNPRRVAHRLTLEAESGADMRLLGLLAARLAGGGSNHEALRDLLGVAAPAAPKEGA